MWWLESWFCSQRVPTSMEMDVLQFIGDALPLRVGMIFRSQVAAIASIRRQKTVRGYSAYFEYFEPFDLFSCQDSMVLAVVEGEIDGSAVSIRVSLQAAVISTVEFEADPPLRKCRRAVSGLKVTVLGAIESLATFVPVTGWISDLYEAGELRGLSPPIPFSRCALTSQEIAILPEDYVEFIGQTNGAIVGSKGTCYAILGLDELHVVELGDKSCIPLIDGAETGAISVAIPSGELLHTSSMESHDSGSGLCFKEVLHRLARGEPW